MRFLAVLAVAFFVSCAPAPRPVEAPKPDPTGEVWYSQTVEELAELNREAEGLLRRGRADEAAATIAKGLPLMGRLLSVPRPTLAATEAASDLDDLYGRMLLANRHYGWARLAFQKNVARWRNWRPQTPETELRRRRAESRIAECDRQLAK